jgi:hypothetical protein
LPASARLDVRRLAALDMHGAPAARSRRRMILSEFALGTLGCATLGAWAFSWNSTFGVILGFWLLGLAANYLPLTAHVLTLWRGQALDAELAGIDLHAQLRSYTRAQVWVLVPFWVAGLALTQTRRLRRR